MGQARCGAGERGGLRQFVRALSEADTHYKCAKEAMTKVAVSQYSYIEECECYITM